MTTYDEFFQIFSKNEIIIIFGIFFLFITLYCWFSFIINVLIKPKLQNIFLKSYVIIFLIFWFAFLIFLTIKIIEVKAYIMCLFTIPFWIAGIYVFYKFVIKNK